MTIRHPRERRFGELTSSRIPPGGAQTPAGATRGLRSRKASRPARQDPPRRPPNSRKSPTPILSAETGSPEPRTGAISGADGLRAIRNRGRSGGTSRRARARTQWPQAFPAGMKSLDPTRHISPPGPTSGPSGDGTRTDPPEFHKNAGAYSRLRLANRIREDASRGRPLQITKASRMPLP